MFEDMNAKRNLRTVANTLLYIHNDVGRWEDFANVNSLFFAELLGCKPMEEECSTVSSFLGFMASQLNEMPSAEKKRIKNWVGGLPQPYRKFHKLLYNRLEESGDFSHWFGARTIAARSNIHRLDSTLIQFIDTLLYRFRSQIEYEISTFEAEFIERNCNAH